VNRPTVSAGDVVREFYRIRHEHGGKAPPVGWAKARAEVPASQFLAFCQREEIDDPLAFIRWRLDGAKHAGHPIAISHLCTPAFAERWREWGEGLSLQDRQAAKLARQAGTRREQSVKALRILTPGMEAVKYPYMSTGRSELCLAEISLSGGYHPESRYCPTCPAAVRCAAALCREHGYDVVSLRAGRLHMLPREIAAAAVR